MPEITKISHGLTIGDLKYGNARPGVVEATLKPGETLEQALDELDERLNAWHKKRYPHLYQEEYPKPWPEKGFSDLPDRMKTEITFPQSGSASIIADIYSCTELKVLESYRIIAKAKPEFQAAYDQQHKKLSNPQ